MKKIKNHYQNHLKPKNLVADSLKNQPSDPVVKVGERQRQQRANEMLKRIDKLFGGKKG